MAKQARSGQTRVQLLDAAAELLRRDGYVATSMVDIASAAGVTKGGLYFHFASKDEICDEVQASATALLVAHVRDQRENQPSAVLRLADLSRAVVRWLRTEPVVGASFRVAREMGARDARFVAFSRAWAGQVRRCVADASAVGELGEGVPSDVVALLVVVICVGLESVVSTEAVSLETDAVVALVDMWRLIRPEVTGGLPIDLHAVEAEG